METAKILENNGDCAISVVGGNYKVLVRIDDKNLQFLFAQKVKTTLEHIDEILQADQGIDMESLPKDVYRHFTTVCKEDYNMNKGEVESLQSFLNEGYLVLHDNSGVHIGQDEMIINVVTLSSFLSFRKEILDLEEFPKIQFALPQSKQQEKNLTESSQTLTQILHKPIGQA